MIGFAIGLLAMLVVGVFSFNTSAAFGESAEQVALSNQRLAEIQELMRVVSRAEGESRGFLITKDRAFLSTFGSIQSEVKQSIDNLRYANDDPAIKDDIAELEKLSLQRVSQMSSLVKTYDEKGQAAAQRIVGSKAGFDTM
ncbi:MAG TPA: CHASE3 domain-containing protein, partial [Chthoniobacteraceae bacterium]|nr:CHASE3 domain-containing protein [Chthoniobacteraceae bacterium]